jgi:hypothetical protein
MVYPIAPRGNRISILLLRYYMPLELPLRESGPSWRKSTPEPTPVCHANDARAIRLAPKLVFEHLKSRKPFIYNRDPRPMYHCKLVPQGRKWLGGGELIPTNGV